MIGKLPRYEEAEYWIEDIVYLLIKEEKEKGMIVGVNLRVTGIIYEVQWAGGRETCHFDFELAREYVPDYGTPLDDESSKPK